MKARRKKWVWLVIAGVMAVCIWARFTAMRGEPVAEALRLEYAGLKNKTQGPPVFRLACPDDRAVFILSAGIQVPTATGWKNMSEHSVFEIRRLKGGEAQPIEIYVMPPEQTRWRACIHYGRQMHGLAEFKAQIREAWILRSFRNWTGKPWGGGRWSGDYEVVSEAIKN